MTFKENFPLVVENLTKIINGQVIIDHLSFKLERGKVYGFLGPNGAGKTTTIRLIAGLIAPTKGDIYVEGHHVQKDKLKALSYLGAIVENPELYNYLTGRENLLHFARMSRAPVSINRIEELIKFVGLEDAIDQKVKTYSLGMKQRLGIAQSLLHKPSLLILDEPSNGLDPAGIRHLRDYLKEISTKENISILVSSHLLQEVELMCDKVIIIQKGKYVDEIDVKGSSDTRVHTKVRFTIKPDQMSEAIKVIERFGQAKTEGDKTIVASVQYEQIPDILTGLVNAGLTIYECAPMKTSLEDQFLSLTEQREGVL
ncbi:ABC-2 type transport system ATP-binding protein [Bacillus oleivorans]|uniref:ABC-2 type transport system ATP-binding protein n=1 Tax=Bacillus oleivorans TaxID=1448271 RepID=A0A285D2K5_9BACI|nr:ABC transporter ATP-binding protein [Bacillus oleivorans]SNX73999.1 ABC-2 type transport system ATP-binding protein [Bacillus oleivorans]